MIRQSTRKKSHINTTHSPIEPLDGSQTGSAQDGTVSTPSITTEDGSQMNLALQVDLPDTVIIPASLRTNEDASFPEARPQVCALATSAAVEELSSLPLVSTPLGSGPGSYSRDMALQLVDLFFHHVQPWLPLLHAPHFRDFLHERLGPHDNALAGLTADEAFLLTSIFALASRFIYPASLQGAPCSRLEEAYVAKAREYYTNCRDMDTHTFTYLQGCTALAFYFYSSGLSAQGWILVGVCVRVAYDLGLSELDGALDDPDSENDWILTEERRRTWWLIWELDSFGSYVSRKPFAIDRSAFSVFLPVADEYWFSGQRVASTRLPAGPEGSWAALRASPNQSERAWYLAAADIMSQSAECLQQRSKVKSQRLCMLKNEISCLRLSLPPNFRLSTDYMSSSAPRCRSNWIIGTHLTLSTASFITEYLSLLDDCEGRRLGDASNFSILLQTRALEISRFAWRWPTEHIRSAHPFFACLLLTPHVQGLESPLKSSPIASSGEVIKLIQSHLGEIWKLGLTAKR
ncbi:uncharacterized protein A1O9_08297 [Exophiala aquamarina CBS 119918]|uniref:Xylanolytic transcriptional activator regulatory domain-containing protein n=1 Tax=Exophiala aquamarina CBS 119918 TaxID=1182545 RepID=A0A072P744_9EURO|nr:uncharacterized protein A1O9_08297 [Exophiala aquamarina CBS 119918]KEF55547.1 hypothetical protein A1O9_08297 [Exophiala aquamarina CBS 119918]